MEQERNRDVKKGLAILLILMLVMSSLAACGKDEAVPADDPATPAGASADEQESADSDVQTADDEKDEDKDDEDKDESEKEDQADKADQDHDQKKPDGDKKPASSSAKPSGGSSGTSSGGSGSGTSSKPKDDEEEDQAPSGTPSEIIEKIYAKQPVDLWLGTTAVDLSNAEQLLSATGLSSSAKIKAAAYSESMMGAQPYSLVVVRVKDSKNTEAVAKAMLDGIDPAKWVCVEADDVRVAAYDDLIMLCMVSTEYADTVTAKGMVKAFKKVCGGKLDVSLKR